MVAYMPPGWPTGVHPPGSQEFERTAVIWLLDVVPPDYRMHGVLRRHPIALATLARRHLAACVEGARQGYRTARTDLGGVLPVSGLDAVLAAYRSEGNRLVTAARAADLVEQALRGQDFTPPLHDAPGRPAASSPGASSPLSTSGTPAPARWPAPSGSPNSSRPLTPARPPTPSDPPQLPEVPDLDGPPRRPAPAEPPGPSVGPGPQALSQKRRQKASTPGKQQKQPTRGKQRRPQAVG